MVKRVAHSLMAAVVGLMILTRPTAAQAPEVGQGWLPEFTLAARQIVQLAEATPADKFGWRPAPGVRSVSEVFMHIALSNFLLLERAGAKSATDLSKLPKDPEKTITNKVEVIGWLRNSMDAVSKNYQSADRTKKVQFFGKPTDFQHSSVEFACGC